MRTLPSGSKFKNRGQARTTHKAGAFWKTFKGLYPFNYFTKKLHLRCLSSLCWAPKHVMARNGSLNRAMMLPLNIRKLEV